MLFLPETYELHLEESKQLKVWPSEGNYQNLELRQGNQGASVNPPGPGVFSVYWQGGYECNSGGTCYQGPKMNGHKV